MSGSPSETEIQTQWKNAVAILEGMRNYADGTVAGGGQLLDVLIQSLEGEYTPAGLTSAAQRFRAGLSSLVDPARAAEFLSPIMFEYAKLMTGGGSGYRTIREIMPALYEHFHRNTLSVETRAITFDTTATLGAGNVGNGAISRLTKDENDYPIEACTVERKQFRCRQDRNTGALEQAEVFEHLGAAASQDALLRAVYGSGEASRYNIRSAHAGSGNGGSLLRNSSFDSYSASATPKFVGWNETTGGANITQQTANYYRGNPSSTVNASLRINGGGGLVTLTQPLENMRVQRINPSTPYFLRVMVNKTVGVASGGTFTIRLGNVSVDTTIAALGANWVEVLIPLDKSCWPREFNVNPVDVEIEWSSSTSGYLLVDDAIFVEWDRIDGTYWVIRGNAASHTPWLLDDTLEFTDTGGAPATGKVQWWLWTAGLGYLPSNAAPTLADP